MAGKKTEFAFSVNKIKVLKANVLILKVDFIDSFIAHKNHRGNKNQILPFQCQVI